MKRKLTLSVLCLFTYMGMYSQKDVRLTPNNAHQTVQVAQDQALELQLPAHPSTGYGWYLKSTAKSTSKLAQAGSWEFTPDNVTAAPGGTGTQTFHYTPTASGTSVMEFLYKRPWMGDASATDSYTITVITAGPYTGVPVAGNSVSSARTNNTTPSTLTTLPTSFNWQTAPTVAGINGIMTPVKDQGQCGSCWSFAANGSFESMINYWDSNVRNLSEQWLINCDAACSGCSGGWCPDDMFQTYGCVYAADLGYTAANGTCGSSYTYHEKITSHAQVNGSNPTDAQIKQAIYNYGPVWAGIDAGNNFQNYSSGVFSSSDGTSIDHAIVLCGWDDAQGCWFLRNSWGSSWGENGYMRIAYGTSGVGASAEYLVYKGIINHNLPPTASFISDLNNTCGAPVQFTDQSGNQPTSWLWNFGDGTTSALQNPTHTYTTSGAFSVTLTATNAFGNNGVTNNNMINVTLLSSPSTTGATRVGPGVVNLSASGTNTLNWYDAASGGNLVNTGTSYAPNLNVTTTYYVDNATAPAAQHTGLPTNAGTGAAGGYYTANNDRRLYFNVLSPMILQSVTIYAGTAGSRQIEILDSAGNSVALSAAFNATVGTNVVPLNITLPAKNNYAIKLSTASATNDLYRNSAGVSYPYTVNNLVSITGSDASSTPQNYYYYFYDWVVAAPGCMSPRVAVTGTINTATGIQNVTEPNATIKIYPNPNTGVFTVGGLEGENMVEIYDMVGKLVFQSLTANNASVVDLSGKDKGVYFYKISNTGSKNVKTGKVIVY